MSGLIQNPEDTLKEHISMLCHPGLEERLAGTTGTLKAAQYLAAQLAAMNAEPIDTNPSIFWYAF